MYCKVPISGKREVWEGLEDWKEILRWEGGERVGDERDLLSEGFSIFSERLFVVNWLALGVERGALQGVFLAKGLDGRETEREFEAGGMSLGQGAGMEVGFLIT